MHSKTLPISPTVFTFSLWHFLISKYHVFYIYIVSFPVSSKHHESDGLFCPLVYFLMPGKEWCSINGHWIRELFLSEWPSHMLCFSYFLYLLRISGTGYSCYLNLYGGTSHSSRNCWGFRKWDDSALPQIMILLCQHYKNSLVTSWKLWSLVHDGAIHCSCC